MKKRKKIKNISKLLYRIWETGQNLESGIIVPSGKKFLVAPYFSASIKPHFIKHYKVGDINNGLLFNLYITPEEIELVIIEFVFNSVNNLDITLQSLLKDTEKIISKDLKGLENIFKDIIFMVTDRISFIHKKNLYKFSYNNMKNFMENNIQIIGWKQRNDKQSYKVKLSKLIKRYEN